ncbi:MAG: Holliday junction branch migration protein RuvA [candidate division WOR-3 bacterium]
MIAVLRGRVLTKEPTRAVLDVNGIGFELRVPLSTSSRLPEPGNEATVLVEVGFTKAGVELFGFFDKKEQEVFRLITAVKGVGPRAALNLLSRFEPEEVVEAIKNKDVGFLRSVPGIGEKKAGEIIKRFEGEKKEFARRAVKLPERLSRLKTDAVNALVSLGLSRREAEERLNRLELKEEMSLQEVLKRALRQGK